MKSEKTAGLKTRDQSKGAVKFRTRKKAKPNELDGTPPEMAQEGRGEPGATQPRKRGRFEWVHPQEPAPLPLETDSEIIAACLKGALNQAAAAKRMGLSLRQAQRKIRTFKLTGECSPRKPGRKAHNSMPDKTKDECLELYRTHFYDMGPTQAVEYLSERHGITVSKETLRKWLIEEDLWKGRKAQPVHRRARERKTCFGEMVQMDSSIHPWLEGQEPFWLINIIDDATGRIYGRFFNADSTETNMDCLKPCCESHGIPLAIYVDRASHFKHNPPKGSDAPVGETQLQRAFKELDIERVSALSAPAKGRVERAFRTLQDRLVKGLRVNGIKNKEDASAYLAKFFIERCNRKFSVTPKSEVNLHRPVNGLSLDAIFSVQEERTVMKDDTFRFNGKRYQLICKDTDPSLAKKKVIIEQRLNGRMAVRFGRNYFIHHEIS